MKRMIPVLGAFLGFLILSGCGSESTPAQEPIPTSAQESTQTPVSSSGIRTTILYDDDGSPDGTTALLFLLSHPEVDLGAISISYGEAHPEIYIQHIGRMLDSFGISDIPLGYGPDASLSGGIGFPETLRQSASGFWGLPIAFPERSYQVQPVAELWVSLINEAPEPITIFVSGPATNLAQALRLDPAIRNNIRAVYMMGGAVNVPGNIHDFYPDSPNTFAEWNIYGDVQAAKEVFESGIPIYLVPLDATNQVLIHNQDTAQWRSGGEIADLAATLYDGLLSAWGGQAAIWDLMTAAIMMKPDLCIFSPLPLKVVTEEGNTLGQTALATGEGTIISTCLEPDEEAIRQYLIEVFSESLAVPAPAVSVNPASVTPAGLILRDDFTQVLQPGWEWQAEDSSRWEITSDGWLKILGEDGSLMSDAAQSNLLCREAPSGEYQVEVHLWADPVLNFQQATLYLFQDGDNYIAINRGYCDFCVNGGGGFYMEYKQSGVVGSYNQAAQESDVYLRLVNQGTSITGYYAVEAGEWSNFGSLGNFLQQPRICLGVSNADAVGISGDLDGRFDYIEIKIP